MLVNHLQIDGQSFYLEPDEDVQSLQDLILKAVSDGPGYVRFRAAGYGVVTVLITPRIGVRFESKEIDDQQIAKWDDEPPAIDAWNEWSGSRASDPTL